MDFEEIAEHRKAEALGITKVTSTCALSDF